MREEYERRIVHASGTLVPVAYLAGLFPWEAVRYLLVAGAALAVALEFLRLWVGLDWAVYDRLTREYEKNNPGAYALAVVAAAIVVWAFEPTVAVPALLMLTVGDPVSGILSSATSAADTKQLGVVAAMFGLCLALALPFLPPRAAVPAAAVAAVADAVKPRVFGFVVDDNFSIPVGAAVTAFLAAAYLPVVVCEGSCFGVAP
jgi:dolichol kinase